MTLDEEGVSAINNESLAEELRGAAYGQDNRPAWIGAYRPVTEVESLKPMATWAAAHYAYYLTFVREYMERRGRALDIGSGAGQNTAMLARYGEATGVEPERSGYEFAMKHNRTTGATFHNTAFPFPSESVLICDYIFCIETLEHVQYELQQDFIDAALALLAPDGRMFITTPDEPSASGPHHGIWTPAWTERMLQRYQSRLVRRGHFHSATPERGFVRPGEPATHHAWVLR